MAIGSLLVVEGVADDVFGAADTMSAIPNVKG
jgi:hypothetical protein